MYSDYVQLYFPESVLRKMCGAKDEESDLFDKEMNDYNATTLTSAISCLFMDSDKVIGIYDGFIDKIKNCSDFASTGATFMGLCLGPDAPFSITVFGAITTGFSIYISLEKGNDDNFKDALKSTLKDYNSEKNLVYTRYTDNTDSHSSPFKSDEVNDWSRWTLNHYVNKYVEIANPLALFDSIRCTVEPMKFYTIDEDQNIKEFEWPNN